MPERKAKLRTASDVISRLRWSNEEHTGNDQHDGLIMMGYTDRIVGPLEKAVKDYVSAKSHGDIPEHRILYFRAANDSSLKEQVLWDRAGRVDRIFQSGNGPNAPIAAETLKAIQEAKQNMIQIELEKEERRKEKAKLRARRARNRELGKVKLNSKSEEMETTQNQPQRRFHWQQAPWYTYRDEWTTGSIPDNSEVRREDQQDEELVIVTWNVLFDIFDAGLEVGEPQLNGSGNLSQCRWELLASMLKRSEPDLISLQEVTPAFVELLLDCEWVKAEYACSASPSCLQSVTPSGVLILWRRTTMAPPSNDCALFQCSDFGRSRSLVATLFSRKKPNSSIFAFSSVHLPADKATSVDTEKKSLRKLARKRELSSILGQLQRLGVQLLGKQIVSMTPIIAGDFNCEDDELKDGFFAGSSEKLYRDAWSECEGGPGLTFDPKNNPRAARSSGLVGGEGRARRIDRIFVGPTYVRQSHLEASNHIVSKSATLLGNEAGIMPPSDHFGVRASFQYKSHILKSARVTDAYSHWSTNSPPSPHYMLAVILDSPKLELMKARNDQQSSLPVLHVTLLHGFVEADFGCLDLVKSVVQDALHSANTSVPPPESLEFTSDDSLGVFEHRASATLVAHPDIDSPGQRWLRKLYDSLRERFQLCDEQETHSSTGWNPHVTMGVTGSSSAARTMQARWIADRTWAAHHEHAAIHSMDVLRRGASGMFQTLASFPITTQSLPRNMKDFLSDAGVSMSQHMDQQAARVLSRVKRACRKVVQDHPVETSIRLVGSSLLKTALPGFSDLDAVIMLRPQPGDVNVLAHLNELTRENSYLQDVAAAIKADYPTTKARLRPGGRAVVLTIRIPNLPSLNLTLCCFDMDEKPINESSQTSWATIRDGNAILEAFAQCNLTAAFQGAVRIIKLWAHQHNVYGSITGYLGGGGWAMWMAACVLEGLKSTDLLLDRQADAAQKSHQLACFFFETAAKTDLSAPIMPNLLNESAVSPPGPHRTGTLSVLSPCSNGDFGRSSTVSTSYVTLTEIRAAASTLQADRAELGSILTTQTPADSLTQFPSIVVFELIPNNNVTRLNIPAELKAWGCQKFLEVLIELEQHCDPAKIRPMPKPLRLGKDRMPLDETSTLSVQGFAWWLGLYCDFNGLTDKIASIESKVTLDATASGLYCKFHVLSSSDAVRRFVKSR